MTTIELTDEEILLIQNIRETGLKARRKKLSKDISLATTPNYFADPRNTICEVLKNRLIDNGFTVPDFSDVGATLNGFTTYDIGFNTYLSVTWYKMPSGTFEIVAYVS